MREPASARGRGRARRRRACWFALRANRPSSCSPSCEPCTISGATLRYHGDFDWPGHHHRQRHDRQPRLPPVAVVGRGLRDRPCPAGADGRRAADARRRHRRGRLGPRLTAAMARARRTCTRSWSSTSCSPTWCRSPAHARPAASVMFENRQRRISVIGARDSYPLVQGSNSSGRTSSYLFSGQLRHDRGAQLGFRRSLSWASGDGPRACRKRGHCGPAATDVGTWRPRRLPRTTMAPANAAPKARESRDRAAPRRALKGGRGAWPRSRSTCAYDARVVRLATAQIAVARARPVFMPGPPAEFRTIIEPFRIHSVEPLQDDDRRGTPHRAKNAGYNLFALHSRDVLIDLLTDSGTGAMSEEQWAGIQRGDESYAGSPSWFRFLDAVQELFPFPHVIPTHQVARRSGSSSPPSADPARWSPTTPTSTRRGRTSRQPAPRRSTWSSRLVMTPPRRTRSRGTWTLSDSARCSTPRSGCARRPRHGHQQLGWGQPVSLAQPPVGARAVPPASVPLFLDTCRFADNAWFIREREADHTVAPSPTSSATSPRSPTA